MQERTVLLLVVTLVVTTATVGVAVNALRSDAPQAWHAFDLSITWSGSPRINSVLTVSVGIRQGLVDPRTLGLVFLSLDMSTMNVLSATPTLNPWGYRTVWNLTSMDLTATRYFNATGIPQDAGSTTVYAMVWVPQGELRSVPIDSTGHVNPAGASLMGVDS